MELNNIFPELNDEHNFIFIGNFNKHKYYKNVDLFADFNIDDIESNTKWNCKLQTNFPGKKIGLLNTNFVNELFDDILLFLQREIVKYDIKWMKNLVYSSKNLGWYNIYKKGFNQERHSHRGNGNILSGVYYYKSPSKIRFYNPKDKKSDFGVDFQPEEGDIILFSNLLEHSVPVYDGEDIRISFSFNLGVEE
tara:strand:- start:1582 stop:2160 length:579 start_codon:yes stop_codon:yes gene_type:complete